MNNYCNTVMEKAPDRWFSFFQDDKGCLIQGTQFLLIGHNRISRCLIDLKNVAYVFLLIEIVCPDLQLAVGSKFFQFGKCLFF